MAEAVLEAPTDEVKALDAEAPVADGAAEAEADAAPLIPEEAAVDAPVVVAPSITIKKIMDDGHGGAHGGAWKIALADMMTAMMAFFLLMWLLGASNDDQRKSIAEGGALNHRSLIEKQKFKICKQINWETSPPLLAIQCYVLCLILNLN